MSKFNKATKGKNQTTTYEGGPATFILSQKENLVRRVLTTFVNEPKFYGSMNEQHKELRNLIIAVGMQDARFIANLAKYTRNELYMRSVTHMLVGELSALPQGKQYVKSVLPAIAHRPDDLTEVLAYYLNTYNKPIPNSLKKGLANAFSNFNEYQLQKYNRKTQVTLKDIVCLTHPKPSNKHQGNMWKRLLEDQLETPYTWETELSAKGNTKEVWENLIESKKVGYMALLRNLRNIINAEPDNIQQVFDYIANPEAVKKSKQLPFRFYTAYREIYNLTYIGAYGYINLENEMVPSFLHNQALETIETAIEHSVQNLELIPGKTILVNDDSASMTFNYISKRSTITSAQIAGLMMSISHRLCEQSITSSFSNTYRIIQLNRKNSILQNTNDIVRNSQGGATYMSRIFDTLIANNTEADRIIIFSDNEAAGHPHKLWLEYKNTVAPDCCLHLIDLAGYGHQVFHGDNVVYTPGWSEKILKFIPLVEKGEHEIVKHIENL